MTSPLKAYAAGGAARRAGAKWFSALEKAIESADPGMKLSLDKWRQWLTGRPGVKKEEMDIIFPSVSEMVGPGATTGDYAIPKNDLLDLVKHNDFDTKIQEFQTGNLLKREDFRFNEQPSPLGMFRRYYQADPENPIGFDVGEFQNSNGDLVAYVPGVGQIGRSRSNVGDFLSSVVSQLNVNRAPKYTPPHNSRLAGGRDYKETVLGHPLATPMRIDAGHFGEVPDVGENQISWALHHTRDDGPPEPLTVGQLQIPQQVQQDLLPTSQQVTVLAQNPLDDIRHLANPEQRPYMTFTDDDVMERFGYEDDQWFGVASEGDRQNARDRLSQEMAQQYPDHDHRWAGEVADEDAGIVIEELFGFHDDPPEGDDLQNAYESTARNWRQYARQQDNLPGWLNAELEQASPRQRYLLERYVNQANAAEQRALNEGATQWVEEPDLDRIRENEVTLAMFDDLTEAQMAQLPESPMSLIDMARAGDLTSGDLEIIEAMNSSLGQRLARFNEIGLNRRTADAITPRDTGGYPSQKPRRTGSKVTFIDELQSYRHQKGRQEGYQSERRQLIEEKKRVFDEGLNAPEGSPEREALRNRFGELEYQLTKKSFNVPDGPYKKDWPLLTFRRMLWQAAEDGSDWLAWNDAAAIKRSHGNPGNADILYDKELPNIAKGEAKRLGLSKDSVKKISVGSKNESSFNEKETALLEDFLDEDIGPEIIQTIDTIINDASFLNRISRQTNLSERERSEFGEIRNDYLKAVRYRDRATTREEEDTRYDDVIDSAMKLSIFFQKIVPRINLKQTGNAWGIKLTPEIREKILKEGLPKFAAAGVSAEALKEFLAQEENVYGSEPIN